MNHYESQKDLEKIIQNGKKTKKRILGTIEQANDIMDLTKSFSDLMEFSEKNNIQVFSDEDAKRILKATEEMNKILDDNGY